MIIIIMRAVRNIGAYINVVHKKQNDILCINTSRLPTFRSVWSQQGTCSLIVHSSYWSRHRLALVDKSLRSASPAVSFSLFNERCFLIERSRICFNSATVPYHTVPWKIKDVICFHLHDSFGKRCVSHKIMRVWTGIRKTPTFDPFW